MDDINYRKVAADMMKQMLPIVYRETPDGGNMVSNRVRNAIAKTMEIVTSAIQELKELKV